MLAGRFPRQCAQCLGAEAHRQKIKKDTTGIKLTAQSRKKLMAIQQLSGVEPNVILKSLIDDAYQRMKEKNKD